MPFPPGHDPGIPEMSNFMSPPAEPGVCLKEIKFCFINPLRILSFFCSNNRGLIGHERKEIGHARKIYSPRSDTGSLAPFRFEAPDG
jgi:hypothetical protein